MYYSLTFVHLFALPMVSTATSCPDVTFPNFNNEAYVSRGDINIGALFSITDYGTGLRCTKKLRPESWVMEYVEALAFAVREINKDGRLLPNNITLGYIILDYCRTTNTALARALSFLPTQESQHCYTSANPETCVDSKSTCPGSESQMRASPINYYDVIGVLGTFSSTATVLVSYLYAVAKLPILSFMATTDELSDKYNHPYFLRVVPPDKYQVLAMLTFISDNGWSFASVLYEEGSYGEKAFDNFKLMANDFGICFAASHKMNVRSDHDAVVKDLLRYPNARVVILFTTANSATSILKASTRLRAKGHFIWIGSDGLSDKLIYRRELAPELLGTFVFMFYSKGVPEFSAYFDDLDVNASVNPWLRQYWEVQGECSFQDGSCGMYKRPSEFDGFKFSTSTSLVVDSVLTFAHAVKRLIMGACPNATSAEVKSCIEGEQMMKFLLNTSFDGYTGRIKFDSEGNLIGKYAIRQVLLVGASNQTAVNVSASSDRMIEVPIATFDIASRKVIYDGKEISWDHLRRDGTDSFTTNNRSAAPASVCSQPCILGEFKVQREIACCWECRPCRSNERIANNTTSCATCEEFTWPDPATNLTTCVPIPLDSSSQFDTVPLIEICLAVGAIILQMLIAVSYVLYKTNPIIKASSRELSYLQMAGMLLGYVTVIVFQTKPSHESCCTLYFMYCLSFAWLYSPLLVKTIRIYRIFECSAKYNRQPRFVSPHSQIIFAVFLIGIQLILCFVAQIKHRPTARKSQPIATEKFVELSCDMTIPGLSSFLAYNLVLVTLCSVFAFKTRKLPENFNESRFISMCVSTTLIIWLSFVATYFTATRDYVRVLLLSVSLLLNHTVALVFLFLPKVYAAAVLVPTPSFAGANVGALVTSNPVSVMTTANRIAPVSSLNTSLAASSHSNA